MLLISENFFFLHHEKYASQYVIVPIVYSQRINTLMIDDACNLKLIRDGFKKTLRFSETQQIQSQVFEVTKILKMTVLIHVLLHLQ